MCQSYIFVRPVISNISLDKNVVLKLRLYKRRKDVTSAERELKWNDIVISMPF